MLSFNSFQAVKSIWTKIEPLHRIREGQLMMEDGTECRLPTNFLHW